MDPKLGNSTFDSCFNRFKIVNIFMGEKDVEIGMSPRETSTVSTSGFSDERLRTCTTTWNGSHTSKVLDCAHQRQDEEKVQEVSHIHGDVVYDGVTITFQGIWVHVGRGKRDQTILSDVSGIVHAGSLTALIGPSGSGKTTLVDVMTRRKNSGRQKGEVLYNGVAPKESFLKHCVAYVEQEGALIANMTVEETFMYNHDLNRGTFTGRQERRRAVDTLLMDLSLEGCRNTLVGTSFQRGISGGQRRRVAIGNCLLGKPRVLFMDEPTSGLDSFTAFEVMSLVKSLARRGLTAISTIHAPNSSIFALFDTLMVLLDGRMVYFGKADAAVGFFRSYGFDGPGDSSAADWLTAIVVQTSRLHRSEDLAKYYAESQFFSDMMQEIKNQKEMPSHDSLSYGSKVGHGSIVSRIMWHAGVFSMLTITRYRMKANYRMANFVIPRVFEKAIFAVIILTLYWGVGKPLEADASYEEELARPIQINSALFMWGILPAFGSISAIPSIFHERHLFSCEKKSGYYNSGAYLFAKVFEEALLAFFSSAVLACAVWFALSLAGSWVLFWLVYFITVVVGVVLSYGCASIAPNPEYAIIMSAGINVILLFFVGLLIRWQDIPSYWKWMVYVNYLHYAWAALTKNQFTPQDTILPFNIPILEYFHLDNSLSSWDYLGYEVIFIIVYFLFAAGVLRVVNYGRR